MSSASNFGQEEVIGGSEDTEKTPEPHVYEFILQNPVTGQLEKEYQTGYLYVTSAFVGVGMGDGEVRYVVPLDKLYKVTQQTQIETAAGNA